jgi:NADH dehydrogenase
VRAAAHLLRHRRPADGLEVAIVSRDNAEVWHGLMPQLLASGIQPQHLMVPLRELLPGATVYTYEIERVDIPNRRVRLSRGQEGDEVTLEFDYLLLALGSIPNLARVPGLAEHGLPAKTIDRAVGERRRGVTRGGTSPPADGGGGGSRLRRRRGGR